MADETVDYITEDNEEDPTWYTYEDTNHNGVLSSAGDMEMYESEEPAFKCEEDLNEFQHEVDEAEDEGDIVADCIEETNGTVTSLSNHNLILKEIINEQGIKMKRYFCQECYVEYRDINEFLYQHPGVELLNENPEEETVQESNNNTQDKLWDLVEDLRSDNDDEENSEFILSDFVQQNEINQAKDELGTVITKAEPTEGDNDRYYCYECQQVFTDLSTAELHDCTQRQQEQEQQQQQDDNDDDEDDDEEDDEYVRDETQQVVDFACAYCCQVFSSYDDLLNHIANCELQNVTVNSSLAMAEATVYDCDLCNKTYPSIRSYNNHQRSHKKERGGKISSVTDPIICEICNTHFSSAKNCRLHMRMHDVRPLKSIEDALPAGAQTEYNELNQFYCEICNKSFDQRLLAIHKNMHQNIEEHNCSRCNKQFENLISYEMHMQMHAENKLQAAKKSDVNENVAHSAGTIATRKKHQCQYCGKEFQRPYEKVKHERIHTGEKPYNCEVCGKTFRVSYSLTLHLRTHTDIRPYVCATCNKRFKQQSVYVHHLKTHIAERQYKCDVCGKSFRTSVQLCGHRNSHKKPFNCTECNRPFASLYAVKIHMKTHNKGHKANKNLKNRCDICGASYARIFALRYHLKEHHGVDVDLGQLLSADYSAMSSSSTIHKDLDAETVILMNAANEAEINNHLGEYINDSDDEHESEENIDSKTDIDVQENCIANDHSNDDNDDLDETAAATQTILKTEEETIEHSFHNEEIITDW